jgi:predicted NBD/HSP70 family sugar kinase
MRFYTRQHAHYCGIDLHARSLYLCILDQQGKTLVHRKLPCDREKLRAAAVRDSLRRRADGRSGILGLGDWPHEA